ncbi:hypothetical protein UNPF46_30900 [Bradyrhizobium sp. UNPF46]|uniref:glycosyltransferase family 77 protein n=1 Tax=Bradyrhizobium sp. UNPF46 TaxID=1141168 RepID=UPI00114E56A9|nr:glycosyltransferase family 77 protein [Bradyrhizobium sp. UNPF46]TQF27392.1 hypothetical protein UNPF46_30900 [Bradyrhizobium sp. UNPF46]
MKGIYYVATGAKYLAEAERSAQSIELNFPSLPVAIFTDQRVDSPIFSQVVAAQQPKWSFEDKIEGLLACPFDEALYLDCDTEACGYTSHLFRLLERVELAVAHASWRFSPPVVEGRVVDGSYLDLSVPSCFPELNTGVILFRKTTATIGFFRLWLAIYRSQLHGPVQPRHEQPAFRTALWNSGLSHTILPPELNYRVDFPGYVGTSIQIIHGRHPRRIEIARRLNAGQGARVFVPNLFQMHDSAELLEGSGHDDDAS